VPPPLPYGLVQLTGDGLYVVLEMVKSGRLSPASVQAADRRLFFRGFMDYQQMAMVVDVLRNENPVQFG
jgi:hypothetical protein